MSLMIAVSVAFLVSALGVRALLATTEHHLHLTGDCDGSGPQKLHQGVVPRVGGVAIAFALSIGIAVFAFFDPEVGRTGIVLLACLMPGFLAGLTEDLTKRVTPFMRLLATMVGAGAAAALFDLQISSVAIPAVDSILALPLIGELVFVVAVGGAAHAFNIIDGQNGLASGTAVVSLVALSVLTYLTGQFALLLFSSVLAASIVGFMLFNYPHGRIFLGDGGAYLVGGAVGLLAAGSVELSSTFVSPWWALLVIIYPVWETMFSVFRRIMVRNKPSEPDALHLHSIWQRVDSKSGGLLSLSSAPRLWLIFAPFPLLGLFFYDSSLELFCLCVLFAGAYLVNYYRVSRAIGVSLFVTGRRS